MAAQTSKSGKSTQQTLLINEIKDGVVVLRDGSIRGVILGSAINFELMSQNEQQAVEQAYQGFINSLHFPIQIVIKSQQIDINPYIDKLKARRGEQLNELLGALMDDYIANIMSLVQEVNIMDKQFYVVVPYYPPLLEQKNHNLITNMRAAYEPPTMITVSEDDFRAYKSELSNRMALVSSGMAGMGIRAIALGSQELVDLYYGWYNPEVAESQKLIDISQMTTPAVTKGDGSSPSQLTGGGA